MGNNISSNNILITFFENIYLDTYTFLNLSYFNLYSGEKPIIQNKYLSYITDGETIINDQQTNIKIYKIYLTDTNYYKPNSFQLIYMIEDTNGNFYKPLTTNNTYINLWIELIYTWTSFDNKNMKYDIDKNIKNSFKRKIYFIDNILEPYVEKYDDFIINDEDNENYKIMFLNTINIFNYNNKYNNLVNKYLEKQILLIKYYYFFKTTNYTLVFYDNYLIFELLNNQQLIFKLTYFYKLDKIIFNYSKWIFNSNNTINFILRKGFIEKELDNKMNFPSWITENTYWITTGDLNFFTNYSKSNIYNVTSDIFMKKIFELMTNLYMDFYNIINFNYTYNKNSYDNNSITIEMLDDMKYINDNIISPLLDNLNNNENSSINILLSFMNNFKYTMLNNDLININLNELSLSLLNKYEFNVENSDDIIIFCKFNLIDIYYFEIKTIVNNVLISYIIKISHKIFFNKNSLTDFEHKECINDSSCCKKWIVDNYIKPLFEKNYLNKNIIYIDLTIDNIIKNDSNLTAKINFEYRNSYFEFNFI